jgi:hypothetical protein
MLSYTMPCHQRIKSSQIPTSRPTHPEQAEQAGTLNSAIYSRNLTQTPITAQTHSNNVPSVKQQQPLQKLGGER